MDLQKIEKLIKGVEYVYVLKLESNKWYVGSTVNIHNRINAHLDNDPTAWTSVYKPIEIAYVCKGGKDIEKELTLKAMRKYGWRNVRGYAWTQVDRDKPPMCL